VSAPPRPASAGPSRAAGLLPATRTAHPLFAEIKGQADSEVLFYLALSFGLDDDPPEAVARAIGVA